MAETLQLTEHYTRVKVLGRGSFGEAVLYSKSDGSLVVWKEISLASLSSAAARQDVDNEVELLSSLSHVNIVQYLGKYVDTDCMLFIEMEYVDGRVHCRHSDKIGL